MTGVPFTRRETVRPGRDVNRADPAGWFATRLNPRVLLQVTFVACLVLAIWPASLGGRFATTIVAGESMEPAYRWGDAVITWKEPAEIGDTILFRVPQGHLGEGNPVIHRIVGGDRNGWITQGDNRPRADDWTPSSGDVLGVAKFHIPLGGWVLAFMRSWLFTAFLGSLAAALLLWPDAEAKEPNSAADVIGSSPLRRHRHHGRWRND